MNIEQPSNGISATSVGIVTPKPDIEPDFHRMLQAFAWHVEKQTEAGLQSERSGKSLSGLVRHIQQITDEEIAQVRRAHPSVKVACTPGCDACCHRTVTATVPEFLEILVLARGDQPDSVKARAAAYERLGDPCPLLDRGHCTVYESRPLSCRSVNSADASACQSWRQAVEPEDLPIFPHQDALGQAATFGLRAGLLWEGLDHEKVDLGKALKWALTKEFEVGQERLLSGEAVPESVKLHPPGDPISRLDFVENGRPAYGSERDNSEPSGHISAADEESLRSYYDLALNQAEFAGAIETLDLRRASNAMAAIVVPRIYRSASEITEWRERFVRAMRSFKEAPYSDSDKFNALSMHRTAGLAYQGMDDREIMAEHGAIMAEITRRALPEFLEPIPKRRKRAKTRLGYLSANMHGSNGCRWALGWLKGHGPNIETYALNVGPVEDGVSKQFRAHADHYFHLVRSFTENARFIKSLELDALIITDIGLHGFNTTYATMRLAPLQCTAWGHPVTSGYPDIDVYLSSELMEPESGEGFYTEKLVRLPGSGLCYEPIEAFTLLDRGHFDLPVEGPLIVNVQTKPKLLPQHDHLYAAITEKAKAPIVFLGGQHDGDTIVTKARMDAAGIRSIWLPHLKRAEFLALLKLADVSLDPPLWSGGNTTIEALSLGTAVVTLPGPLMRGRHSLAFLNQANGLGMVATDETDYIELACDFERQRAAMSALEPGAMFLDDRPVKALDFLFHS